MKIPACTATALRCPACASFAGSALYLMPRITSADSGMMRVVVPGDAVLVFDKPGPYRLYHEQQSPVDGRYYSSAPGDGRRPGLPAGHTGAQVARGPPTATRRPDSWEGYTVGDNTNKDVAQHPWRMDD